MDTIRGSPVVLVLASGRGVRFAAAGGQGSKLAAPLAGRTVLAHTLAAVEASGLRWHVEAGAHPGMGDTIAAAVRATEGAGGWLVLPGDLPAVAPGTIRAVAAALGQPCGSPPQRPHAVQPRVNGLPAHPVGFDATLRDALLALRGDAGARSVLAACRAQCTLLALPLADEGALLDIDTPADLARAARLLAGRSGRAAAPISGG